MSIFKRRKADPTLTQVVQNLSLSLVTLEGQFASMKRQWAELEEHVDKRWRSMRASLGAAASARSAGGQAPADAGPVDGGTQHVHRPAHAAPPSAGVSTSKAELLAQIERGQLLP